MIATGALPPPGGRPHSQRTTPQAPPMRGPGGRMITPRDPVGEARELPPVLTLPGSAATSKGNAQSSKAIRKTRTNQGRSRNPV
eukprot:IDg14392t1